MAVGRAAGTERNVTIPNCLIPGRAMRELIGNTGARDCVHERSMLGEREREDSIPHARLQTRATPPLSAFVMVHQGFMMYDPPVRRRLYLIICGGTRYG